MRTLLVAICLTFASGAAAQTAVGGGMPASARQVASFGAASFLPTDDPLAFSLNPALLPGTRDGFSLSGTVVPSGTFTSDDLSGGALAYGGSLRLGRVPLSVGAGLSVGRFANSFVYADETGQPIGVVEENEAAGALSIGVETVGPVRLAVGGSTRLLRESRDLDERDLSQTTSFSADLGVLATADLAALSGLTPEAASGVVPAFVVSAGYTARNLGPSRELGFVFDGGTPITTPLRRQAALGWGASVGADLATPAGRLPLLHVRADLEASGSLLEYDFETREYSYAGPLGDLTVGQALTGSGRIDELSCGSGCTTFRFVDGHRSVSVDVLGAASLTLGWRNYGSDGPEADRSWGLGLDPLAALRTVRALRGESASALDRYSVRVDYGRYLYDPQQVSPGPLAPNAFTLTLGVRP